MLWLRPYTWVNRNGSAAIASTGVAVNTANVVFTFKKLPMWCSPLKTTPS